MANHHLCKTLSAAALVLGAQGALAAPVLQYSGTDLLGATGVDVNGTLYNVQFENGSCNTVFGVCQNAAPGFFTFDTSSAAIAASNALLSQIGDSVFTSAGSVGAPAVGTQVYVATPYAVVGSTVDVQRYDYLTGGISAGQLSVANPSQYSNAAYAVWSLDTAAVPEPASAATLAAGVAALALARRRRRKK